MKKITVTDQQMVDLVHLLNTSVKVIGIECVCMAAPLVEAIENAESFESEPPPKKARNKKPIQENK